MIIHNITRTSLLALVFLLLWELLSPLSAQKAATMEIGLARSHWPTDEQSGITESARLMKANSLRAYYAASHYDSLWLLCEAMEARGLKIGNTDWIANAWHGRGKYYKLQGMTDSSFAAYQHVLTLVNQESHELTTRTLGILGRIKVEQGQLDLAIEYLQRAIELGHHYGHERFLGPIYLGLSDVYHRQGRYLEEIESLNQARIHGHPNQKFYAALEIARLFWAMGLPEEAKAALAEAPELGEYKNAASFLVKTNALYIEMAPTLEEARSTLITSTHLVDSLGLTEPALMLYTGAARAYIKAAELDTALYYAQLAVEMGEQLHLQSGSTDAITLLADIHHQRGAHQASLAICRAIKPVIEQEQSLDLQRMLYSLLSKNFEALGRPDSALHYVRKQEGAEATFNSNALAKSSMSTYLKLKSAEEREALQAAKSAAEQQALAVEAKSKLVRWVLGLLSALLAVVAAAYFLFYRHKNRVAERLEQLNQKLENERQKLQASNQKLSRFSKVVSHDILSTLDLILSAGHVLVRPDASKEKLAQYATITKESSRQLKDYCIGLLREARGEQASRELLIDPVPIVQRVLSNFSTPLKYADLQVVLAPLSPALLPAVIVEQIFINLISNALRYGSTAAKPLLRITEERPSEQGAVRWVIEDNGPGLPSAVREAIFNKAAKAAPQSQGQYLGLKLLRESLESYGAQIRVEERAGGGARFVVLLPENGSLMVS